MHAYVFLNVFLNGSAIITGMIGVPLFLVFWYAFALRSLLTRGPEENDEVNEHSRVSAAWQKCKAEVSFCLGRVSELPIYTRTLAPLVGPTKEFFTKVHAFVIKHNPKNYIKIIVSFFQVSASFLNNIDVNWPSSAMSVWQFFAFSQWKSSSCTVTTACLADSITSVVSS